MYKLQIIIANKLLFIIQENLFTACGLWPKLFDVPDRIKTLNTCRYATDYKPNQLRFNMNNTYT